MDVRRKMKGAGLISFSILTFSVWMVSCSADSKVDRPSSEPENVLRLGPFKEGHFISDEKPLRPEDVSDLREVAFSLPIWESGWEAMEDWVVGASESGIGVDEWTNPADGAQHAVTLRRLKDSPEGRIRVEVNHPPLKIFTPSGGIYDPWVAVLVRGEGGWWVESAGKANGQTS